MEQYSAKYQMNPIFPNMLSCGVDLSDIPWAHRPMGQMPKIRGYRKRMNESKRKPVMVADRSKLSHSVISFPPKSATALPSSSSSSSFIIQTADKPMNVSDTQKSVQVETQYRDSSAQTDPWEPPVKIVGRGDPEILTMEFNWARGLPITACAVEAIERARMKTAWMKIIKPNKNDERSLNRFKEHLLALELDEWKYREEQIDKIQNMRLGLLEGIIQNFHETSNTRTEKKMARIVERIEEELKGELDKVKRKTERNLRRHDARRTALYKANEAHISKNPEMYVPLVKNRQDPKSWHEIIDEKINTYQFIDVENISTAPKWLKKATIPKKPKYTDIPNKREINLCIRETKWKPDVLLSLQTEFRNKQKRPAKRENVFLTKIHPNIKLAPIQIFNRSLNNEKIQFPCAVLLQKVLTGHPYQLITDKNRDNGNESIHELEHSAAGSKEEQRVEFMVQKVREPSRKLQSMVMGSLFDFLSKEESILKNERTAYAICLINETERFTIDPKELQQEIHDRNEHNKMFKKLFKSNYECNNVYSGNNIIEGTKLTSEVGNYIKRFSERIDSETKMTQGVEMITEILHSLLLEDDTQIVQNKEKLQIIKDEMGQQVEELETYLINQQYSESVDLIKSEEYDEDNTYSFVSRLLDEMLEITFLARENSAQSEYSTLESLLPK